MVGGGDAGCLRDACFLWASFSLYKYLRIAEVSDTRFLPAYLTSVVSNDEVFLVLICLEARKAYLFMLIASRTREIYTGFKTS